MRILIIHNEYQFKGGEYQAVKNQIELLTSMGHDVIEYIKNNEEIKSYSLSQLVHAATSTIYSKSSFDDITELIKNKKPDIAHVHNVFPLLSPSIYQALNRYNIPIVQTIHNFRFLCPNGLFYINDEACELCKFGNTMFAITKKCYKNSYSLSTLYSISIGAHRMRGTFDLIDKYITLTEFSAQKLIESGLTKFEKISILGNFIPSPLPRVGRKSERKNYVVYIGRLSKEKGVEVLLRAGEFLRSTKIKILGTGPELDELNKYKENHQLDNVSFLGHLTGEQKWEILQKASAVVIPSTCFETFSVTAIESMSVGTPVVASRIGSLPFVINEEFNGLLFEPGDPEDLAESLQKILNDNSLLTRLGEGARKTVEEQYSQEYHFENLINIYTEVLT